MPREGEKGGRERERRIKSAHFLLKEDNQDKNCILSIIDPANIFKEKTMSIIFFRMKFSSNQ